MEYCDCGTLLQRINRDDFYMHPDRGAHAALVAAQALVACAQEVAAGMAHLHSLNIIHGGCRGSKRRGCGSAGGWARTSTVLVLRTGGV